MGLEQILAEKIAWLARKAIARDAPRLVWVAQTSPYSQLDRAHVRRLAMLTVWVDNAIASLHDCGPQLVAAARTQPARGR